MNEGSGRTNPSNRSELAQTIESARVTLLDARNRALEILERAERERLRIAEAEARRGVDWQREE